MPKPVLPLSWFRECKAVPFTGTVERDKLVLIAEQDKEIRKCNLEKQSIKKALQGAVEMQ